MDNDTIFELGYDARLMLDLQTSDNPYKPFKDEKNKYKAAMWLSGYLAASMYIQKVRHSIINPFFNNQ